MKSVLTILFTFIALLFGCQAATSNTPSLPPTPSSAHTLTSFSVPSAVAPAVIGASTITLSLPYTMSVGHLVADFTTTGTRVTVNGVMQTSGVSVQDFSGPVYYTVHAADESTQDYAVVVSTGLVTTWVAAGAFVGPQGLAADAAGNLYVADTSGQRILKVSPSGVVSTFAGSGTAGFVDGSGASASFNYPFAVAVDPTGTVYVVDIGSLVRKVDSSGMVTTLAGNPTSGFVDATGTNARFDTIQGIAVDASGEVFVADTNNLRIRRITSQGVVSTFAGSSSPGNGDGQGTAASFDFPGALAIDGAGTLLVADQHGRVLRRITSGGAVTTVAGTGATATTDGPAAQAAFSQLEGIAVGPGEAVFGIDRADLVIRKLQ